VAFKLETRLRGRKWTIGVLGWVMVWWTANPGYFQYDEQGRVKFEFSVDSIRVLEALQRGGGGRGVRRGLNDANPLKNARKISSSAGFSCGQKHP